METNKTRKSDSILWHYDYQESFDFLVHRWDVSAAKKIISNKCPRKIDSMNISGVVDLLSKDSDNNTTCSVGISIDWEHAKSDNVNINVPIILVHHRDSYMPIDGWHRIAKASVLKISELPCVILTKKESKSVKVA